VGRFRNLQRLAQARMWQDEVVVDVEQRQLMLHAVLALAQRVDPAADRGHALAQVQIEPLYKPTVCLSVASHNLLLYQSLPIIIPYRYALLRRRKDDASVGTAARGIVE
jgi:hypothetical protein